MPFALIVFPRTWRDLMAGLIGAAAAVSVAVTMSTSLSVQATRPTERSRFYGEMWKVDPAAVMLPVEEALLLDDQCPRGFQDRLYPVLGVAGGRHVGRIDCAERTTAEVEAQLRRLGAWHVYVLADPAELERTLAPYTPDRFELLSRSTSRSGGAGKLERLLYPWLAPGPEAGAAP